MLTWAAMLPVVEPLKAELRVIPRDRDDGSTRLELRQLVEMLQRVEERQHRPARPLPLAIHAHEGRRRIRGNVVAPALDPRTAILDRPQEGARAIADIADDERLWEEAMEQRSADLRELTLGILLVARDVGVIVLRADRAVAREQRIRLVVDAILVGKLTAHGVVHLESASGLRCLKSSRPAS